jgi:hypothetical protein
MSQIATDSAAATLEVEPRLTASDRCDLCGAQAYVHVKMESGELMFCAHHGAKFKEKLQPTALDWHDESSRLIEEVRS